MNEREVANRRLGAAADGFSLAHPPPRHVIQDIGRPPLEPLKVDLLEDSCRRH